MTFSSTVPGTSIGSKYTVEPYNKNMGIRFTLGLKQGGRLIPKHAKGSTVNTNPLPEMPVNTNPIPKKEDKKNKSFKIDQRIIGNIPPQYLTFPRGNGRGLYMIKRNE